MKFLLVSFALQTVHTAAFLREQDHRYNVKEDVMPAATTASNNEDQGGIFASRESAIPGNLTCNDISDSWYSWIADDNGDNNGINSSEPLHCDCKEATYGKYDFLQINCGFCVGCANSSFYNDEKVCIQDSQNYLLWKNVTMSSNPDKEELRSIRGGSANAFSYTLPDGSTKLSIDYYFIDGYRNRSSSNDEKIGSDELKVWFDGNPCTTTPFPSTCVEENWYNETTRANYTYNTTQFKIDCTDSPLVDKVVSTACKGIGDADGTPFQLLFEVTSSQCLSADGVVAFTKTSGDPHITTFDGVQFDCQATGEFILVKSQGGEANDELEIQGRFENATGAAQVSIMTAGAVNYRSSRIQIALDDRLNTCDAQLYVDGSQASFANSANVDVTDDSYTLTYEKSFLEVKISRRQSTEFGCFFTVTSVIPSDNGIEYTGLYGSPDGNPNNDWMDRAGNVIAIPSNPDDLLFEPAYNYCTSNWCIDNEQESLFAYPTGKAFSDYKGCDVAYNNAIETALQNTDQSIKDLCGDDVGCLVDGTLGGVEDAQVALQDTKQFVEVVEKVEAFVQPPKTNATFEDLTDNNAPTDAPTHAPTDAPTHAPTEAPTDAPANTCECGRDVCKWFQIGCLFRNNCRKLCGCPRLFFSCD